MVSISKQESSPVISYSKRRKKSMTEEASKRFPVPWKWDHAINLKEDVPSSIDCRIYPLSLKEKEAQHAFIEENLHLKWIH
jgi:hypothetical protein